MQIVTFSKAILELLLTVGGWIRKTILEGCVSDLRNERSWLIIVSIIFVAIPIGPNTMNHKLNS